MKDLLMILLIFSFIVNVISVVTIIKMRKGLKKCMEQDGGTDVRIW